MNVAYFVEDSDFAAVERARSIAYASTAVVEAVPCFIRNVEPLHRGHRQEQKYRLRGMGPRNRSGKARS